MQDSLKRLLEQRTNRAVRVILGTSERDFYDQLTEEQQRKHRQCVRDILFEMQALVMDLIDAVDTGGATLNDLYLRKLDEIHTAVAKPGVPAAPNGRAGRG